MQAKLLSVVENRTYRRLGAKQDEVLRCRLVAATQDRIDTDLSRKDLWARFQTVTIPPLRDRPEEIEPIAQHFLGHFQGLESKKGMEFSPAALSALAEQTNLRNSRDLEQVIQNAVGRLSSNSVVQLRDLNLTAPNTQPRAAVAVTSPAQVLAAVPSTESVLAAPVKKLIPEVVIERIALADVVKLMAQVAVPEADEDLRGVLSAFDEKCSRIRKELVLAALYSCRHKMSGKVNILSSMQLLANDESLKGTQAKRELKMTFGLPGSGPVNRQWLQQLVAEWIVRKNQSNDL